MFDYSPIPLSSVHIWLHWTRLGSPALFTLTVTLCTLYSYRDTTICSPGLQQTAPVYIADCSLLLCYSSKLMSIQFEGNIYIYSNYCNRHLDK